VLGSPAVMQALDFHNNTIVNSGSCKTQNGPNDAFCSLISLPGSFPTTMETYIQNNTFIVDPALGIPAAITWYGSQTTTPATATKVHIQDNYFDGFQKSTIWLYNAGLVTMERNTFGPNTFSNANTVTEETVSVGAGTGAGMIVNEGATSNRKIVTWRPTTVSAAGQGCLATVAAAAASPIVAPGTAPALPLRLDVYWTATSKAEQYLGSQTVSSGTSANLTITLPTEAYGPGGTLVGGVRLQTQALEATQMVSSQFSRVLPLTGAGDPACSTGGVDSIVRAGGSIHGGDLLTLKGTGLLALVAGGSLTITLNGDAPCAPVTAVDDETLTCVVPPSSRAGSRTGPVSVAVYQDATETAFFEDGWGYKADGELRLTKRPWTDAPEGLSGPELYAVLTAPEHGGATEVVAGGVIRPGTVIAWTYTLTYVHLDDAGAPVGGDSDVGLYQVEIVDDQNGLVCTIPVLYLNTPTGCASSPAGLSR